MASSEPRSVCPHPYEKHNWYASPDDQTILELNGWAVTVRSLEPGTYRSGIFLYSCRTAEEYHFSKKTLGTLDAPERTQVIHDGISAAKSDPCGWYPVPETLCVHRPVKALTNFGVTARGRSSRPNGEATTGTYLCHSESGYEICISDCSLHELRSRRPEEYNEKVHAAMYAFDPEKLSAAGWSDINEPIGVAKPDKVKETNKFQRLISHVPGGRSLTGSRKI